MGRAARWLKGLFGIKIKDKDSAEYSAGRRSSGFCNNPKTIPPNITPAEAAWLRSFYADDGKDREQSKHAIAVAAATAAAADAAVAAAQAAAAVVRLTSQKPVTAVCGEKREISAAVMIQSVFRGFLARKALRALKGLVKIQALVRGFLVRKQAAATLHSMQALIRAQANVRAEKMRRLHNNKDERCEHPSSLHSRRLSASFDNAVNSFDENPKIVEVDTGCRPKSRSSRANSTEESFGKPLPSAFQCRIPARNIPGKEWAEECHFSTAQSTPRFAGSWGCIGPVTPAKSVCGESFFRSYGGNPNYMAKTQSFKAKVRSYSAPKQRPEPGSKRRLSLHEMMESRNSVSGARMQRSCSQAHEAINFKNAVMENFVRDNYNVCHN